MAHWRGDHPEWVFVDIEHRTSNMVRGVRRKPSYLRPDTNCVEEIQRRGREMMTTDEDLGFYGKGGGGW